MADLDLSDDDLLPIEGDEAPAQDTKGKSLDDVISKALDGGEPEEPAGESRQRDERGRFAPKTDSEAEAAPDEGTSAKPAVVTSTEQPQDAKAEPVSDGHFRGWSPEQKEAFQKLPPEAQKVALDVVQQKDRFYGDKLNEWQRFGEATAPLVNVVKPHLQHIRTKTDNPSEYVKNVLDVDYRLQYAPYAEKVQLLGKLAQSIGVPFAAPQTDAFADPLSPGGEAYPVIHDLRTELAQLKAQVAGYEHQQSTHQSQQVSSQIALFGEAKNADGSPKHPWFNEVKGVMGQLIASGQARTLEEAYAVAEKPITERFARELAARQQAAAQAQAASIAKAKKAAPVRTSAIAPGGKTSSRGLDAVLSSALDSAGFQ